MAKSTGVRSLGIWGDSVLKGIVQDAATQKYKVARGVGIVEVASRFGIELINHSHFGFTVVQGKQALQKDLERGVACEIAIIEYGGNDCEYDWQAVSSHPELPHLPHTPLEVFVRELRSLVEMVRAHAITPILMSLPPIVPERYFRGICRPGISPETLKKWLGTIEWTYLWHEKYSNAIVALSVDMGTELLDVRRAFLDHNDYQCLLCADGIHPSCLGQGIIGRVFSDFLERWSMR